MTGASLLIFVISSRAFDNQPAPVVFLIPVVISAYLGGLGPGLVSTILGVVSADYFTTPPYYSFRIVHPIDYLRLGSLLVVGVLVSILSESLHRAKNALQPQSAASHWLPLERKVRSAFGFAAICLLLIAAISYRVVNSLRVNDGWVDHTHQVMACLTKLLSTVTDGETGVRGYVITGDERNLGSVDSAMAGIAATQHELRAMTRDNPSQQRNLDALDQLIAERLSMLRTLIALRRTHGFTAAQANVATQHGQAVEFRIRSLIDQMMGAETALLKDRDARAQRSSLIAKIVILSGSLAALLVVLVALFLIGEDFTAKRRLEANLAEAQAKLEERVVSRTQALADVNEQLRKSELQLRLMVSGVKDYAIFMLDPQGFVAGWNPGLQRLKGWSADEIVGQHFSRFYSPEDNASGLPARELEIAKAEGQFSGEGWRIRKDGSRFWATVIITPVVDDDGRLLGFSKVTRDTTEHRRIAQAMKEEEARLAAVIGSAMDAVITVDERQLITLFNPAAEKMFGYSAAAVLGTPLELLMPDRFRGSHSSHIRNFAQTNTTRRKMGNLSAIFGLRSTGEEFPMEASISQTQIDGQKIFSVILRDITERVKADEALRRSDTTRRIALDAAQLGDWQIDVETGIAQRSTSHDRIFGYSEKLPEWNFDIFMQHVHPEDREKIRQSFKECLDQEKKWDFECRIVWPDQSIHWIWACGSHYKDQAGKSTHVMGTVADVTERKRSEAQRLRSQKLEGLGTLAGGIAHDFNNILLAIAGNAKLAIADLPPDHAVQESLAEIAKASSRATQLVRRILTFSRPDEMKRQVCELRPIVEEALKLVRATLPATIAVRQIYSPNLPAVLADSTQIHQIIVNLTTNAAHAIGAKSDGMIEIRLDAAQLTSDDMSPSLTLPEGNYVRLYISDNGCGMDRATLECIYDPFFTTKGPGEGTGLGLSVVHGIMKSHDGGIAVYSEPGRGTAFRLFFPAAGSPVAIAQQAPRPEQRVCTERVLYVDDEQALVMLVTRTLGRLGYKVTGQTDPLAAVALFRSDPTAFDVIVTDLAMPQLSGFDLSSQILAIRPDIPIVMTSGYVRPEDQQRAVQLGVRDLILKPDTIDQLGRTLDRVLQHHLTDPLPIAQ